jgi:hypothetical protein
MVVLLRIDPLHRARHEIARARSTTYARDLVYSSRRIGDSFSDDDFGLTSINVDESDDKSWS